MTSKDVSDEQLGRLARRQQDLFRRVREGSIPIDTALKGLQNLIEEPSVAKTSPKPEEGVEKPESRLFSAIKRGFTAKVKYKDPSIKDLCKLFPVVCYEDDIVYELTTCTKEMSRKTRDVSFVLLRLGVRAHNIALQSEMSILGFRPAVFAELVAFAKRYPNEQRGRPIVAFGSIAHGGQDHCMPIIGVDEEGYRCIDFAWHESHWDSKVWFLAVPEAPRSLHGDQLPPDHHRFTVASTKSPTFEELKGAYNWLNPGWGKCENVPHESLRELTPTAGEKIAFIKTFDPGTMIDTMTEWASLNGYRFAFPAEREALTKTYPELQEKSEFMDLGTCYVVSGEHRAALLHCDRGQRYLNSESVRNVGVLFDPRVLLIKNS